MKGGASKLDSKLIVTYPIFEACTFFVLFNFLQKYHFSKKVSFFTNLLLLNFSLPLPKLTWIVKGSCKTCALLVLKGRKISSLSS